MEGLLESPRGWQHVKALQKLHQSNQIHHQSSGSHLQLLPKKWHQIWIRYSELNLNNLPQSIIFTKKLTIVNLNLGTNKVLIKDHSRS